MWIVFSFFTAFFEAVKDGACKKSLYKVDPFVVAWAWKTLSLPLLIPLMWVRPWPEEYSTAFFIALGSSGVLVVLASIIYTTAIKSSELSLTLPLLSFSPVFLLGTSPLIVGEYAGMLGVFGVLLIIAGTYILNVDQMNAGIFEPIKALFVHKGPRLMVVW